MDIPNFVYSSVGGYLLAIANNAVMNMGVQISVLVPVFSSCVYTRSGVAISYNW